MNTLPNELIGEILCATYRQFMKFDDRYQALCTLSMVCKKWREMLFSSSTLKHFYVKKINISSSYIIVLLAQEKLEHLKFRYKKAKSINRDIQVKCVELRDFLEHPISTKIALETEHPNDVFLNHINAILKFTSNSFTKK